MTVGELKAMFRKEQVPDDAPVVVWNAEWGHKTPFVSASWTGEKVVLVDEDNDV